MPEMLGTFAGAANDCFQPDEDIAISIPTTRLFVS
jgi:hypothetical protein